MGRYIKRKAGRHEMHKRNGQREKIVEKKKIGWRYSFMSI